jgi:DtxR family Mn-dependent transcriptional regulator
MKKAKQVKKLSSHMEDYLEAICFLKEDKGIARVRDIGRLMGVKNPSVTGALNVLAKDGLILHERYGYVDLTEEGQEIADRIKRRHEMLAKFLSNILNIDSKIADKDACKMEHILSSQTFQKLTKFIEFVESCPDADRPDWLESFDYYFKTGKRRSCKIREMKQRSK